MNKMPKKQLVQLKTTRRKVSEEKLKLLKNEKNRKKNKKAILLIKNEGNRLLIINYYQKGDKRSRNVITN